MRANAFAVAALLIVPTFISGCSAKQRIRTEKALADALISDEQEEQLGLQVHQELEKQNVKYVTDPAINEYVASITNKILPLAERDRKGVKWHVHVIDDPKQVNAFATPGGHLYVFSGLLLTADNEAEIAGVLAHEAGHVVGRHSARQMVNAYGLQTVAGLALGKNPNQLAQIAAQLAGTGVLLAHSRSEEKEADELAVKYTSATGYDPHGIAWFFEKLQKEQGHTPQILTWLSTHPATEDRITHVNQLIAAGNLPAGSKGDNRLPAIKQRILATSGGVTPAGQK